MRLKTPKENTSFTIPTYTEEIEENYIDDDIDISMIENTSEIASISDLEAVEGISYQDAQYNLFMRAQGLVNEALFITADEEFNKLPDSIKELFVEEEWHIVLSESELTVEENDNVIDTAGITNSDKKEILLYADDFSIVNSLLHEVGHSFDAMSDYISSSEKFTSIYEEEKNTFVYSKGIGDEYEIINETEFFACVFDDYFSSSESLQTNCPKAYAFLNSYIN